MSEQPPVTRALLRQPHFWLVVLATVIGGALSSGVVQDAEARQILTFVGTILAFFGYQVGARWQPPRAQWSEDQRMQYYLDEIAKHPDNLKLTQSLVSKISKASDGQK